MQRSTSKRGKNKYRPDIVVRCGPIANSEFHHRPERTWSRCSRPRPTTSDRGPKLGFCEALPSVQHIALIYQDEMSVEHYRRTQDGFALEVLKMPADVLRLSAVEFEIALERVYFRVDAA